MKYPKEYLNEIKTRLKVSTVVSKSVALKKRGKEYVGLSPFKNEKTPSFTVNDEKEFYHCFSTGEHGNIFDFLMKTKSVGFGEAVKILASEAGLQPYRFSSFDKKKDLRFQTYKNIIRDYRNYFHGQIFDEKNKSALNYLEKRGLDKNVIEDYTLGFVPWKNSFYEELKKNYTEEEINLTGLPRELTSIRCFPTVPRRDISRLFSRPDFPVFKPTNLCNCLFSLTSFSVIPET